MKLFNYISFSVIATACSLSFPTNATERDALLNLYPGQNCRENTQTKAIFNDAIEPLYLYGKEVNIPRHFVIFARNERILNKEICISPLHSSHVVNGLKYFEEEIVRAIEIAEYAGRRHCSICIADDIDYGPKAFVKLDCIEDGRSYLQKFREYYADFLSRKEKAIAFTNVKAMGDDIVAPQESREEQIRRAPAAKKAAQKANAAQIALEQAEANDKRIAREQQEAQQARNPYDDSAVVQAMRYSNEGRATPKVASVKTKAQKEEEELKQLTQEFEERQAADAVFYAAKKREAEARTQKQEAEARLREEQNVYLLHQRAEQRVKEDARLTQLMQDRLMQEEYNSLQHFQGASRQVHYSWRQETPVKDTIFAQTRQYYQDPEKRTVLEQFGSMLDHIQGIPQDSNVHILDGYVFTQNMISGLLKTGKLYNIDNGDLSLAQVGDAMIQFVNDNRAFREFFDAYKYNGQLVQKQQIINILNAHFTGMDNEVHHTIPAAREVWSRAWTLALKLYTDDQDMSAIQIIFDQALEGHLTGGGCLQGRVNRGFIGYASLLAKSGVNPRVMH